MTEPLFDENFGLAQCLRHTLKNVDGNTVMVNREHDNGVFVVSVTNMDLEISWFQQDGAHPSKPPRKGIYKKVYL